MLAYSDYYEKVQMVSIDVYHMEMFRKYFQRNSQIDKPARLSEWGDSNAVYGQIATKVVNEGQQSEEEPR